MEAMSVWWNDLAPFTRLLAGDAIAVLVALFLGGLLGSWVRARLKGLGIDELVTLPWRPVKQEIDGPPGSGDLCSYLVDATIWVFGVAFIAHQHENKALADVAITFTGRVWTLGILVFLATFLANAVSRAVTDVIRHPALRERLETALPGHDKTTGTIVDTITRAVATLVFGFLFLLVFITLAELLGLNALGSATAALWQLGLRLISVTAALAVGGLGVLAVSRAWNVEGKEQTYEEKVQGFTRLGLVAVTTVLAVDLVTSAASTFTWLAVLFLLAVLLEPLRASLLDVWAGFAVEYYAIKAIKTGEAEAVVERAGFLNTTLRDPAGKTFLMANREVLAAHFQATRDTNRL